MSDSLASPVVFLAFMVLGALGAAAGWAGLVLIGALFPLDQHDDQT